MSLSDLKDGYCYVINNDGEIVVVPDCEISSTTSRLADSLGKTWKTENGARKFLANIVDEWTLFLLENPAHRAKVADKSEGNLVISWQGANLGESLSAVIHERAIEQIEKEASHK